MSTLDLDDNITAAHDTAHQADVGWDQVAQQYEERWRRAYDRMEQAAPQLPDAYRRLMIGVFTAALDQLEAFARTAEWTVEQLAAEQQNEAEQ